MFACGRCRLTSSVLRRFEMGVAMKPSEPPPPGAAPGVQPVFSKCGMSLAPGGPGGTQFWEFWGSAIDKKSMAASLEIPAALQPPPPPPGENPIRVNGLLPVARGGGAGVGAAQPPETHQFKFLQPVQEDI